MKIEGSMENQCECVCVQIHVSISRCVISSTARSDIYNITKHYKERKTGFCATHLIDTRCT